MLRLKVLILRCQPEWPRYEPFPPAAALWCPINSQKKTLAPTSVFVSDLRCQPHRLVQLEEFPLQIYQCQLGIQNALMQVTNSKQLHRAGQVLPDRVWRTEMAGSRGYSGYC